MGLFQRLFGGTDRPPVPSGATAVELVPGKLRARVTAHDFPTGPRPVACWTYVTDGFLKTGQKEFVFTLVRGPRADPGRWPVDPLRFFTQIYSLAEQNQIVDAGGSTCFSPRAEPFLGLRGLIGFAYTPPQPVPGVELPAPGTFLTAVLLVPGEAEVVQGRGSYRVLARLGRTAFYYPHPPWSDPSRPAVLDPTEFCGSFLGRLPQAYLGGAAVRMAIPPTAASEVPGRFRDVGGVGDRVTFRVPRVRLPRLREIVEKLGSGAEGAFALSLDADPDSDARIAWQPGDTTLNTIAPSADIVRSLTGGFLAVVYGPTIAPGGRVVEDGFGLMFGSDDWSRLRQALISGTPVEMPTAGPGHLALSVEWTDS